MGKHEGRAFQCWVAIDRISLPSAQRRYVVIDHDPARRDSDRVHLEKPFMYQAMRDELIRLGIKSELIPPESYFGPTSDEREEQVEVIFREVPARTGFRK
jgi:hypothetical protein